jgi:hypothetical protein
MIIARTRNLNFQYHIYICTSNKAVKSLQASIFLSVHAFSYSRFYPLFADFFILVNKKIEMVRLSRKLAHIIWTKFQT